MLSLSAIAQQAPKTTPLVTPALGNTTHADRQLAREVADDLVVDPRDYVPLQSPRAPSDGAADTSDNASARRDVWNHIRTADSMPINETERVAYYREQYVREAIWISKILHRSKPFLAYLVNSLDARYMPVELALLPAIESGFKTNVHSADDAAGIWQIVPLTANDIGIQRTAWFDGRTDIVASTTAAMDYLSYLNAEFDGDWELTLAAYNAGLGRVRTAMRRNAKANKPTDFPALSLPAETRNYVPKLMALLQLIKDEARNPFDLPAITPEPAFVSIDVGFRISLGKAAQLANMSVRELRKLNAGWIHGITAPDGPHTLHLPTDLVQGFQDALAKADKTRLFAIPQSHVVVRGDTISNIARAYGITPQQVLDLNNLDDPAIFVGQELSVIDARNAHDTIEYVVSIGDTLMQIARRFDVKLSDITDAEGDPPASDTIHPGQTLRIAVRAAETG